MDDRLGHVNVPIILTDCPAPGEIRDLGCQKGLLLVWTLNFVVSLVFDQPVSGVGFDRFGVSF